MKKILTIILLIFINFFILGCIDKNDISSNAFIEGECNLNTINIRDKPPLTSSSFSGIDAPTVILLHGKNHSPEDSDMLTLASTFNFDGYNVVMPYMSWNNVQWNSTFCDDISYLNYLVVTESGTTDQDIILAGYDLGATVALAYTAMSNTAKPYALNVIAPSHFIHQSTILADAHAEDIARAKELVENNQSEMAYFQTYNDSSPVNGTTDIFTTPEIYLSFHDEDEFPNIASTTPLVRIHMLWLAGEFDPLTDLAISHGIIDLIPSSETYIELPEDHYSILNSASGVLDDWYDSL